MCIYIVLTSFVDIKVLNIIELFYYFPIETTFI